MRWRVIAAAALLVPVAEIAVLIAVGEAVGIGWAVLAMLATSTLGALVLRREGRRSLARLREAVNSGQMPGTGSSDAALRILGGVGLLFPGFVTDLAGVALLTPPTRRLIRRWLVRDLARWLPPDAAGTFFGPRRVRAERTGPAAGGPPVIEGEIVEPPRRDGDSPHQ